MTPSLTNLIPEDLLHSFQPITLEEMSGVKLMNRTDTKFVTDLKSIIELLKYLSQDYKLQEIEGQRNMPYFTLYYDTQDTDMFYQHQRGKKVRQKVRTRLYEGTSEFSFLEIKSKNNRGRTKKKRVLMEGGDEIELYPEFMESHCQYQLAGLKPQIENHFFRLTLVNMDLTERITIDTGLEFYNLQTGRHIGLSNLGIIEWKRDGRQNKSNLEDYLRRLHIHQHGFSKYCVGMAMTNPDLKQNRLKEKIRVMDKIISRNIP